MDEIFDDGAAYNFGKVNDDCWHLYTITPVHHSGIEEPDQTLEILMTDLCPQVMSAFSKLKCEDGNAATKVRDGGNTATEREMRATPPPRERLGEMPGSLSP